MKNTLTFLPLVICFFLLLGYNFMSAQWSAPGNTPPNGNVSSPVNVGSTTQAKAGNFMANIMAAATSTWSPRYCDELGANCWDPASGAPVSTSQGTNIFSTMRVAGYSVAPAPAGLKNGEWPNVIICEQSGSPFALYAHQSDVTKSRYRDLAGRIYDFNTDGTYQNRNEVMANCSSKSIGGSVQQICDSNLCIW